MFVGGALPRSVPRIVGPLEGVARAAGKRFAKPKGGLPPLPVAGASLPEPRSRGPLLVPLALAVVVAAVVGAMSWAVADHPASVVIGLVAGLLVSLLPAAVLLWLSVQRPGDGDRSWLLVGTLSCVAACALVAGVAAVIWRI